MSDIKIGKLTVDAAEIGSRGNAILGIRDSGKTYTATLLAEKLHDAGIPFVAFDPIGVWRFLRVPGKGKGYPVVVAGGVDGDLPLTPKTAPAIVEAAVQNGISLVIDLFSIELSKADWRRIVRDCIRLLLHKNQAHGLRHVFIEEAAEFCPQMVRDGDVYAEVEKLARMGGNSRLGYTLINQRSEEVNKAVLELCDNLFLHRQRGRNSLTALGKWLDIGAAKNGKAIIDSLSQLPSGECWAWIQGTGDPTLLKVPQKNSFHPDRREMRGDAPEPTRNEPIFVGAFVDKMKAGLAHIEKEIADTDPKELRARIARLETELRAKATNSGKSFTHADIDEAHRRGLLQGAENAAGAMSAAFNTLLEPFKGVKDHVYELGQRIEGLLAGIPNPGHTVGGKFPTLDHEIPLIDSQQSNNIRPVSLAHHKDANGGGLTGPQMRIVQSLMFWLSLGFDTPSREQVAAAAGYSVNAGSFKNPIGALRVAQIVDYPSPGLVVLLKHYIAEMPDPATARDRLLKILSGPERKILEVAMSMHGVADRESVASKSGYSVNAGSFKNPIGALRTLGLVEYPSPGYVKVSDWVRKVLR